MEGRKRRVKKIWSKTQTRALLEFYRIRQAEFQHSRRKKYAYEHVLDDMISAGFVVDETTTPFHLEVKIVALLRAYKAAKDKSKDKKAAPCVAPFMTQMDEIFGLSSSESKVETISCGAVDFEVVVKEEYSIDSTELATTSHSCSEIEEEIFPTTLKKHSPPSHIHILPQPNIISISGSNMPSSKLTQADYYEKRIEQHNRSEKEKSKRWAQYLRIQEQKAERHREKMKKLDSIINILLKPEY